MKIVSSKDKAKVTRWARKQGRQILWLDDKGFWHAAVDESNTPKANHWEKINVVAKGLPTPRRNHIGDHLRYLRESAGVTQAQLAAKMQR